MIDRKFFRASSKTQKFPRSKNVVLYFKVLFLKLIILLITSSSEKYFGIILTKSSRLFDKLTVVGTFCATCTATS